MNIYAYHSLGYHGESLRIQVAPSSRSLSILGMGETQARQFRLKAASIFSRLGNPGPTGLLQVPPKIDCSSLELAMLLALLLFRDGILETSCPDIMVMGKTNLDGSIEEMDTLLDAVEIANTRGCGLLISPITQYSYATDHLHTIQCRDIATALHQCRRFILSHEGEQTLPTEVPAHTPFLHPFTGIIGLAKAKKALALSAAGSLNILFYGPPGGGKTLLLNTLEKLLPPYTEQKKKKSTASGERFPQNVQLWRSCLTWARKT